MVREKTTERTSFRGRRRERAVRGTIDRPPIHERPTRKTVVAKRMDTHRRMIDLLGEGGIEKIILTANAMGPEKLRHN